MKVVLLLLKNILTPLDKSMLIPLELTAAASAADAGIHKKFLGFGTSSSRITLISSNEKFKDIMKTVKFLKDSGLLIKGVTLY